jgi:hypothetical protein
MEREVEDFRSEPSQESPLPMHVQLRDYSEKLATLLGVRPRFWRHPGPSSGGGSAPFRRPITGLKRPGRSQIAPVDRCPVESRYGWSSVTDSESLVILKR